jgi:hypothetical protein
VTKEEFIGRAADAILRARAFDPEKPLPGFVRDAAISWAYAALEAVGAWETRQALKDVLANASWNWQDKSCGHQSVCICSGDAAQAAVAKAEGR